jgi:hypothetical protein
MRAGVYAYVYVYVYVYATSAHALRVNAQLWWNIIIQIAIMRLD